MFVWCMFSYPFKRYDFFDHFLCPLLVTSEQIHDVNFDMKTIILRIKIFEVFLKLTFS